MRIIIGIIISVLIISSFFSCNKDNDKDEKKPWIVLLGNNPVFSELNQPYNDSGAIAWDINAYGDTVDISDKLKTVSNVNIHDIGKYEVKYNVEDDAGNKAEEVIRTVYIQVFKK
jgi:hypothetical protein